MLPFWDTDLHMYLRSWHIVFSNSCSPQFTPLLLLTFLHTFYRPTNMLPFCDDASSNCIYMYTVDKWFIHSFLAPHPTSPHPIPGHRRWATLILPNCCVSKNVTILKCYCNSSIYIVGIWFIQWFLALHLTPLQSPPHPATPQAQAMGHSYFSYSNAPLLRVSTASVCSHSLEVTAIYPPHPFPLHFHASSLTFSLSGKMPARQDWSSWGTVGDIWHDWWSEGIRTFFWLQGSSLLQSPDQTVTLTTLWKTGQLPLS